MSWSDKLLELCENYQEALENYQTPNKRVKKTDVKEVLPPVTTKEAEETPTATTTAAAAAAAATAATAAATTTTTTTTTAGEATLTTTTGATTPTTTTTTTTFTENDKQVICGLMNNETSEDFDDFYPEFKKNNPLIVQAILNSKSNNDKNISEKDFVMNYINKLVCKERSWFSITTPKNNVIFKTHEQFMKDSIRSLTNDFFSEYNPYANLQFDYFYNTFLNEENENLFKKLQDDKKNNTNDDIFKYINTLNNNKILSSNLFLNKKDIEEKLRKDSCAAYNIYIKEDDKTIINNFYYFNKWFENNYQYLRDLIIENNPEYTTENTVEMNREYIKKYFNTIDCSTLLVSLYNYFGKKPLKFTKDEKSIRVPLNSLINLVSNVVQEVQKEEPPETVNNDEEDRRSHNNRLSARAQEESLHIPPPLLSQPIVTTPTAPVVPAKRVTRAVAKAAPVPPPLLSQPIVTSTTSTVTQSQPGSTRVTRATAATGKAAPATLPNPAPKRNAAKAPPPSTQPEAVSVTEVVPVTEAEEENTCRGVVDGRCENVVHGWAGPKDTNYQLKYNVYCTEKCKQKNRCVPDDTFCDLGDISNIKLKAVVDKIHPNRISGYKTFPKTNSYPKTKNPNG